MKYESSIGKRVRVLSSQYAPGHRRPDFSATVESVSGPHEHMGKEHYSIFVRDDSGRSGSHPHHKIQGLIR